jgi:hypothetical protein
LPRISTWIGVNARPALSVRPNRKLQTVKYVRPAISWRCCSE